MKHVTTALVVLATLTAGCQTVPCDDEQCLQRRAALMQYYRMQAAQPVPEPYYQIVPPVQMQQPAAVLQQPALSGGAIASWTGRQWAVTTVTHQSAINCEYRYGQTVFTRLFQGFCPSTVTVQ